MSGVHTRTKNEIFSVIGQHEKEIKSLGVKKLGLFGSHVRNEQNTHSDIDLLVEFEEGRKAFDNFMQLSFLIEDLFDFPIELVTTESLSPYLGPNILREVEYAPFST